MKTWLFTALGGAFIALSSSVFATKPDKVPESPADVVFPAGGACPAFDLRLQTETRGSIKFFANGDIHSTGYERAWVTNLSSGETIELMVNGRVRIVPPGDDGEGELIISGPQLIIFFAGDAGPGNVSEARTYYFKGKMNAVIDSSFVFLDFEFSGKSVDICAALS